MTKAKTKATLTDAQVAHDSVVQAKAKHLLAIVKTEPHLIAIRDRLQAELQTASSKYWPSHPDYIDLLTQQTDIEIKDVALRQAKAELRQLQADNPRAFGKPWLTPVDRKRNEQLQSEIDALQSRITELSEKLTTPFEPSY